MRVAEKLYLLSRKQSDVLCTAREIIEAEFNLSTTSFTYENYIPFTGELVEPTQRVSN